MFGKIMSIIIFIMFLGIDYAIASSAALKTQGGRLYHDKNTFWKVFTFEFVMTIIFMLGLYSLYTWG